MIEDKKILALIPARGGSKEIPKKNIQLLNGTPLIAYTIEAAIKSGFCDDIIVSTDNQQIADISQKYGASIPFLRPAILSEDNSKTIDAVMYTINKLEMYNKIFDILLLLQPTSPLRTQDDIKNAMQLFILNDMHSVASINAIEQSPFLIRSMHSDGKLSNIMNSQSTIRRQDQKKYYIVNGAIYINKIAAINHDTSFNDNEYGYIMPKEKSIDIDTWSDFNYAQQTLLKT